jgi:hypothetical protein
VCFGTAVIAIRSGKWESKTSDFEPIRATTGNHGKPDPELPETKDGEKHFRENALPTGKMEAVAVWGRADVGDVPTAETLSVLMHCVNTLTSVSCST